MIPLKLQLKNFLSYGPKLQEIDFGSYPLICLSGKNGHGKSALLDAMTWALWGQARKTSGTLKPDAQLLRLGQTTMLVIFDFAFNGQTYRIRREFALTKKGNPYASLEFGILEPGTDHVRPLTEKTIRGTQKTIETMLGLDFDAFINSAFLRQGQANEFSKKSPKDRKEILASILQLDKYEVIRKVAMEKVKHAQSDINYLAQLLERIENDLTQQENLTQQLKKITIDLENCSKKEQEQQQVQKELEHEKELIAKRDQEKSMLQFQFEQNIQEQKKQQEQLLAEFEHWRSINKKQRMIPDSHELKKQKETLTTQITRFAEMQEKSFSLKEAYLQAKEKEQNLFNQLRQTHTTQLHKQQVSLERLQTDIEYKKLNLDQLQKKIEQTKQEIEAKQKELEICHKKHSQLEKIITDVAKIEQQFEKRKSYYHKWIAQANFISSEKNNLEQKKALIHDPNNPSCPLCEQNLSSSRKKFLKNQFAKQEHTFAHQLKRFSTILGNLKQLLVEQHKQLEVLLEQKQQIQMLQSRTTELKKEIEEKNNNLNNLHLEQKKETEFLQKTQQDLTTKQKLFKQAQEQLEKTINEDATYMLQKNQCENLKKSLETLNYDQAAHKKATEQLQKLTIQEQELSDLQYEITQQEHRKANISNTCQELKKLKINIATLKKELQTLDQTKQKDLLLQKQTEVKQSLQVLQHEKEQLLQQHGSLEEQQRLLEKQKTELKEHQKKVNSLHETIQDYQILATALSKDGIQALLIEDVLPEIEQEANTLLAQLTNNQAHIIIESLRDLKKGGTKETLDIKISDPMGIRPYEMFSGGEAFRIDFALRIAISKLLARRAGTSLQTLIIDEGFGSQDEEGLGHLMDAILNIQDNFAKVIIVSHLPAMKEQFPVHFMVNKGPQGSIINVVEHG